MGLSYPGTEKLCTINVYLPTNNPSVNSHIEYAECLDILDNMISKFRCSHKLVLCGDFNGTLLSPRPYNKHDQLLKDFVKEHNLSFTHTEGHTFFHLSGNSSSQIDYVMSTDNKFLHRHHILNKDCENTSSHVAVSAILLSTVVTAAPVNKKPSKPIKKLLWQRVN